MLNYFKSVFENDEEEAARKKIEEAEKKKEKTFTQEQVNDLIAKEKGKVQKKYSARIETLEQLRSSANLSKEENESLSEQIEEMKNEHKTKEQLATDESTKMKKEYTKTIEKLTIDSHDWQNRYTDLVIDNAIINSSVEHNAFAPEQIVALIRKDTRLIESKDDNGKKTGEFEPITKFNGVDENGKDVELDIKPGEAVKRMATMDKYFNLFKTDATGGLGANNQNRGSGNIGDTKNTETYIKLRTEGKLETGNQNVKKT